MKNNKEKYISPEFTTVDFESEDAITTSSSGDKDNDFSWDNLWN